MDFVYTVLIRHFRTHLKANQLYLELVNLNNLLLKGSSNFNLSQYKFFTELAYVLLESSRTHGTGINLYLPEIKKALINDMRFEKKIKREFAGGLMQMLIVQSFGIIFMASFHIQLKKDFILSDYTVVFLLSFVGLIVYLVGSVLMRVKTFSRFEKYLKSLYQARILLFANVPIRKIHEQVDIQGLPIDKNLFPLKERFLSLIENIKKSGELDRADMDMLIEEVWFIGELKFEDFVKHLAAFKLFIIVFFFMSAFMLILIQSLESLAV
jgi:hypothetical protein